MKECDLMSCSVDRRIFVSFHTLDERGEIEVSSSIIDFIIWYNNHTEKVINLFSQKYIEVNINSLMVFWLTEVGKCKQLEEYLKIPGVEEDAFIFAENYFDKIIRLKKEKDKQIFHKRYFRSEEQTTLLKEIFARNPKSNKIIKIENYLNSNKMDVDHINQYYAQKIIDLLY
jgi:hypothetical protein